MHHENPPCLHFSWYGTRLTAIIFGHGGQGNQKGNTRNTRLLLSLDNCTTMFTLHGSDLWQKKRPKQSSLSLVTANKDKKVLNESSTFICTICITCKGKSFRDVKECTGGELTVCPWAVCSCSSVLDLQSPITKSFCTFFFSRLRGRYLKLGTASRQVYIATSRLHEAGVIHGNLLHGRNIIQSGIAPCIIDFSTATRHHCQHGIPTNPYPDRAHGVRHCQELVDLVKTWIERPDRPDDVAIRSIHPASFGRR